MMVYLSEVKYVFIIEDERVVSSVFIYFRFLCKIEIIIISIFSWFVVCKVIWMYRLFSISFKLIGVFWYLFDGWFIFSVIINFNI